MCEAATQRIAEFRDSLGENPQESLRDLLISDKPRTTIPLDQSAGSHRPSGGKTRKEILDELT